LLDQTPHNFSPGKSFEKMMSSIVKDLLDGIFGGYRKLYNVNKGLDG